MRYINFPEPQPLKNVQSGEIIEGSKPATALQVVRNALADRSFGSSLDKLLSQQRIAARADAMGVDRVLVLEESDYDNLLAAVSTPADGYNPALGGSVLPFLIAIKEAKQSPV